MKVRGSGLERNTMKKQIPMASLFILVASSIALALIQVPASPPDPDSIVVSPSRGTVPFSVRVTIPDRYRDLVTKNCSELKLVRFAGVAFQVDWGDGKHFSDGSSEDASCGLAHVYTVPGTYEIKARLISFTDCCGPPFSSVRWAGTAKVTVDGSRQPPSLNLLSPKSGETLPYQTVPAVRFKVVVDRKYDLVIQLITKNGTIVAPRR